MSKSGLRPRILALLQREREGLPFDRIQAALEVKRKDRAKLLEEMKAMERERLVRPLKGRYVLSPKSGLVRGRFVTSRPGYGFVAPEGGGDDIFVPARFAPGVLVGDEVEVLVRETSRTDKPEGRVVRVLKRHRAAMLGVYKERAGTPFVEAFDSPSPEEIALRSKGPLAPRPGMIIEVDRKSLAVSRIFGRPEDPGVDTAVVIRRYGLAAEFPEAAIREADEVPSSLSPGDLERRRDFRDWPTVTIDGETAQDFDDAVSIKPLPGGGFLLGVHIADVSHYVRPGTALDAEAAARATSVYFPGLTLPMLPEKLSNDLCSLRPAVPRLTVSVLMEISADGRVFRSDFAPSVIRTVERMTYTSVFRVLEGDEDERRRYAGLVDGFLLMRDLARALRARRIADGGLDFDLVEPELVYEQGKLLAVAAAERNEAHRLIEEFMVAANVAVASFLTRKGVPAIYRVHPVPAVADLEKLRDILVRFGYLLPAPEKVRSTDLAAVLEKAKGRPEEKFVGIQVLRAMKLALYSPENVGHYGLAKTDYAHFTSPIRRYPDLAVHRILKSVLETGRGPEGDLDGVARLSSERERTADEAEKALVEWRIFRLLKDRLGDEFAGVVVDVTKAGLVVELDDYFVDGLLAFRDLDGSPVPPRGRGTGRRAPRGRRHRKLFDPFAEATPRLSRRAREAGLRVNPVQTPAFMPGSRGVDLGDRVRVILVSCDPFLRRMGFIPGAETEGTPR